MKQETSHYFVALLNDDESEERATFQMTEREFNKSIWNFFEKTKTPYNFLKYKFGIEVYSRYHYNKIKKLIMSEVEKRQNLERLEEIQNHVNRLSDNHTPEQLEEFAKNVEKSEPELAEAIREDIKKAK